MAYFLPHEHNSMNRNGGAREGGTGGRVGSPREYSRGRPTK